MGNNERQADCTGRRGIGFEKVMLYEKMCIFAHDNNAKKMTTFIDTLEETDVAALQDDLTPEQRAYWEAWEASIERDMQNPNRGKEHRPIEELRQKMLAALEKHYEEVSR